MKNSTFSLFLLLSLLFLLANVSDAAITCGAVNMKAASCVTYVTGKAPKPAPACCSNLQALAKSATTVADRRTICRCLKAGIKNFAGVQEKLVAKMPATCGIKVPFPVSMSVNCDLIK